MTQNADIIFVRLDTEAPLKRGGLGVNVFSLKWDVAMALYDVRNRRLIVSRDRLGEIPLTDQISRFRLFRVRNQSLAEVSGTQSVNECHLSLFGYGPR
jgi:hypothetical protein